jgi:rhamnogalacturonan acetylesterase
MSPWKLHNYQAGIYIPAILKGREHEFTIRLLELDHLNIWFFEHLYSAKMAPICQNIPLTALLLFLLTNIFTPLTTAAKIYLCGDSTMARGNGQIDGWGEHLDKFMTIPVINRSIGGRSARSYTVEGRFAQVAAQVVAGDTVVIEFGHNDGGSLANGRDNGRTDCPGSGAQTCEATSAQGKRVTVRTFPAYLIDAGKAFVAKGAKVVFSSMTPNNIWEGGSGKYSSNRFSDYAKQAAVTVGQGASFVDHGLYTAKEYQKLGASTVNGFYKQDHTHTTAAGARVVAEAFVQAVLAAKDPLSKYVKERRGS